MSLAVTALLVGHGLLHLIGFANAFGLTRGSAPTLDVSRVGGLAWLVAALALVAAGVAFTAKVPLWWMVAVAAVVLSQALLLTSWSEARFGTLANVLILLVVIFSVAWDAPWSLRGEYRSAHGEAFADDAVVPTLPPDADVLTESELEALPDMVAEYVRRSGAVGRPPPTSFEASWTGRIRAGPDEPWMPFAARQFNVIDGSARYFLMRARRAQLPVDVLHVFLESAASMRVRLLSLVPLVTVSGPELHRAETVTFLNDLALLAPGALADPSITWEVVDEAAARAHYSVGRDTITVELRFDPAGNLTNFLSDDRGMLQDDGSGFVDRPWSTPVLAYRTFGSSRAVSKGEGRWNVDGNEYVYIELELTELIVR